MNASELKQHFKLKIEEIKANPKLLADKMWRLENLYVINTKSDGKRIFKLSRAQRHFLENMRHRNIILKSRQLGFSTLITLWILDEILFSTNKEAIAIAHIKEGMTDIFDKKAKFAIMNLPDEIKRIFNFKTSSKTKLQVEFGDGSVSSFGVSLSGRSGTYHYVHISEYAKLSKQFPQRAEEVITGTLPAVPFDGRVFMESTAEGACYSQDTEVLTDSGWKLFKDLKQDDKILSMDENNNAYYQKDWIFQKHWFDGNLISFKNQKVDLLVTPNHNLYVKTQKGKFKHRRADSLLESSTDLSFKKAFNWNGIKQDYFVLPEYTHKQGNGYRTKKEVAIPMNIWLEFLGYFFSEGCTNGNGSNIRQTVGKYQKEMFDCAKEVAGIIGANYHISEGTRITINSAQLASYLRKYEKPKTLPRFIMELDKEQLSIFFEAFYLGDGDIGKRNQSKTKDFGRIYTGIYDELTNDISEVALKLGYSVRTEKHKTSNCRIVFFSDKKTGFYKTYKHKPQQVKYTGYVYCVTLPKDHIVLVRRNGKINWCGNSGSFYDMYYDALKNKNKGIEALFNVEFYPHFYNWTWDDMELDRFTEIIPVEMMEPNNDINWKSYQQTHNLTDKEMTYYYMRWLSVKRDLDRLNQEYPTTIEEAFVASGKPYFDVRKIVNCKARVQTPEYYDIVNYEVTKVNMGPLSVYKQPEKNKQYVVGADTAEGLSNGDYSTCTVVDVQTRDIVAIYQEQIPPDEFKDVVIAIGRYYNKALLAIESNKDGMWVNNEVERSGYDNIYYRQRIDDVTKQVSQTFGWKTDRNTRDTMLTELRSVFTEKDILVEPLLDEMQAFVRNSRGKPEAMSGKHDDLIISTAIAYMVAKLWFVGGASKLNQEEKPKSHMDLIFANY